VFSTCHNCSTVSRAFKSDRRRSLLSFEHHRTVASLKPELVEELLDWCEAPLKNGKGKPRSVRQLQEEIVKRHNNKVALSVFVN
jgi:hypothetical protein